MVGCFPFELSLIEGYGVRPSNLPHYVFRPFPQGQGIHLRFSVEHRSVLQMITTMIG